MRGHGRGLLCPSSLVFPSSCSSSLSKRSARPTRRPSLSTAVTDRPRLKARKRERWPCGGTQAQFGHRGSFGTPPCPPALTCPAPISTTRSQPVAWLSLCSSCGAGGLLGGWGELGGLRGLGGAPTLPRRWISCCFLGLTWRRSSGCRCELWHGGRGDPPGHPRGKARARAAAAKARRDRGQTAPGPLQPPRSQASCTGVAVARVGCQAGGSCAHRPSVKKSCGEWGQRGDHSPVGGHSPGTPLGHSQ